MGIAQVPGRGTTRASKRRQMAPSRARRTSSLTCRRAEELARELFVKIHGAMELAYSHVLVICVGDVNRSRTKQQRRSPLRQERNIGGEREDPCLESFLRSESHRRNFYNVFDERPLADRMTQRLSREIVIADRAEGDLGFCSWWDHIGRDAARDQSDGVMRSAQRVVCGPASAPQRNQRIEQLLDS